MRKKVVNKLIGAGVISALVVSTVCFNVGTVSAACKHSFVTVQVGSTIRSSYTHEFQYPPTKEWLTCTVNKILDTYVGKCTKCGVKGGYGYTKEHYVHLHDLCPGED